MRSNRIVPLLIGQTLQVTEPDAPLDDLRVETADGQGIGLSPLGPRGLFRLDKPLQDDLVCHWANTDGAAQTLRFQIGGFTGRVTEHSGFIVEGRARNQRHPDHDCAVCALGPDGVVAFATARADDGGRFTLRLPPEAPAGIRIGVAGSNFVLDDGILRQGTPASAGSRSVLTRRPIESLSIRIKISCPNLKEAPMWGDFHFANSLAAAFERLGHRAAVDTADMWHAHPKDEDVVLMIRGRHRMRIDPGKINLMWIISHPDRIPAGELEDYDHVAVASDVYAAQLRADGLADATAMHQATDANLFGKAEATDRKKTCLFVGNSRREYRTMVKWCVQSGVPFDLYGGGWEGVLPENMVRATSIANADLPAAYAGHLILLNDHWDSMRDNGFLSNRLFDGSAAGTPIVTDPVLGLSDVFGDAISEAADIQQFKQTVQACLEDPKPFLERAARARDIVLGAHTFDHRAAELSDLIDRIAARKRPLG